MNTIVSRLSEPSSWAGIAAIVTAASQWASGSADPYTAVTAILAGALAVLRREGR